MKKVAFVVNSLAKGGMERVVVILSNKFIQLGYAVSVVVTEGRVANEYSNCSAEIIDLTQERKLKSLLAKSFYLKEILESFDAIFLHHSTGNRDFSTLSIFQCFLHYSNKTFLINHSNNNEYHLTTNKKLAHCLFSSNQNVISICNAMQKNMESEYKLNNVKTIYNPIDITSIQVKMNEAVENDINYQYILTVGRFDYAKNYSALVRAYAHSGLTKENVKLVIIGKYDSDTYAKEYHSVKTEIFNLNIKDNVILLGEKDNPFKYMKNALFLVMSSRFEGFGLVLAECLATGTPVVSYDLQTGPNEIIVHEHNGLLVENQNEQKLTEAIDRLYTDKTLYEKCKNNAKDSVKKFDVNVVIKEWETLINNIENDSKDIVSLHDSLNPHGSFTNGELVLYIEHLLNYQNIVEYIMETVKLHEKISKCAGNIYQIVEAYCSFFNCSPDIKNTIMLDVTSSLEFIVMNGDLNSMQKEDLLLSLHKKQINNSQDEIFVSMLGVKLEDIRKLQTDKWYKFGQWRNLKKLKFLLYFIFEVSLKYISKKI